VGANAPKGKGSVGACKGKTVKITIRKNAYTVVKLLRKISKIGATRCQMLRLKCTKFDFRMGKGMGGKEWRGWEGKGGEGMEERGNGSMHPLGFSKVGAYAQTSVD